MLANSHRTTFFDDGNLYDISSPDPELTQKPYGIGDSEDDDPSTRRWVSPLTTQWHDRYAKTCLESPVEALGRMLHSWIATFLDKNNNEVDLSAAVSDRRHLLRRKIEHFVGVTISVTNAETAMLACCQWATLIMLKVDQYGMPIWKAARDTAMRPRLVSCLRMTNLGSLWDGKAGILFWVVAVCHCATTGQCFPLLTTALQARFAHIMALSERYHAIGITPLTRLYRFERLCCTF